MTEPQWLSVAEAARAIGHRQLGICRLTESAMG